MNRLLPLLIVAMSCQSYQFEPVEPVTITIDDRIIPLNPVLKPNVMLTVDRSGSMGAKIDAACQGAQCATRMGDLKQAVSTFTALADAQVRLGLTAFPRDPTTQAGAEASCLPASSVSVPLPVTSRSDDAQADQANRTQRHAGERRRSGAQPGGRNSDWRDARLPWGARWDSSPTTSATTSCCCSPTACRTATPRTRTTSCRTRRCADARPAEVTAAGSTCGGAGVSTPTRRFARSSSSRRRAFAPSWWASAPTPANPTPVRCSSGSRRPEAFHERAARTRSVVRGTAA
jgi:hypothetical protein